MVALPQSVWARVSGLCLFLFCLLCWGTWIGGCCPNKRQIMGLLLGQTSLVWVVAAKRKERSGELLRLTQERNRRGDEFSKMMRSSSHTGHAPTLSDNNRACTVYRWSGRSENRWWKGHRLIVCLSITVMISDVINDMVLIKRMVNHDRWLVIITRKCITQFVISAFFNLTVCIITLINNVIMDEFMAVMEFCQLKKW